MRWNGIKNGKLMSLCVDNNFDLLLTIDKNLIFQQDVTKYEMIVVVLNCATSKIDELILFMPSLKAQISTLKKSNAYFIDK